MFHLLLDQNKKELQREYKMRLATVWLMALLLIVLIAGLLLVPSIFLSRSKEALVIKKTNELQDAKKANESADIKAALESYKQKVAALAPSADQVGFSKLLESLSSLTGQGVVLSSFAYTNTPGTPFSINITGVANDRQSLVVFSKQLEQKGLFSKVDIPTSDFAKDKDIPFSIMLTGKQ